MPRLIKRIIFLASFSVFGISTVGGTAAAECGGKELCAGTVISAKNIDSLQDWHFGGHRLGDIVADRLALEIRQFGLTMKLTPTVPYRPDPRLSAATAKYSDGVKLDPAGNQLEGWVAGVPFPNLDGTDPKAGWKIAWNIARGRPRGDIVHLPNVYFLLIGPAGLERVQEWAYFRYGMAGNYRTGATPTIGDGSIYEKVMLFAKAPQDIKGIGTFTVRYANGRLDDSWAYVREVRRTRRLSGGAWMEPVGSLDFLGDDIAGLNANPGWYKNFELVGRKTVLAIAHHERPMLNEQANDAAGRYPRIDLTQTPHWNPVDHWEPRDVYVVKATTPDDHLYGYRTLYVDAETWAIHIAFNYDKKGDFWKTILDGTNEYPTEDDPKALAEWEGYATAVDFQKHHASVYYSSGEVQFNGHVPEDAVSLPALEAIGR